MTSLRNRANRRLVLCAVLLCLCGAVGCIPSRARTGGLFATDPVAPPVVRVLLPELDSTATIASEGRFILRVYSDDSAGVITYSSEDKLLIRFSDDGIHIETETHLELARGVLGFSAHAVDVQDLIRIDGRPYYGALVIGFARDETPIAVNRLNMETYLAGVLTPELGERSADEFEAVKAQAVASRTYALSRLGQYKGKPYDLRADVGDQMYVGASRQRDWVDRAVAATGGEVLIDRGHLIDAYYHSTCGGWTDAIEDIWSAAPQPYLVSAPDDSFCQWSKYSEWTETFDLATLLENLNTYRSGLDAAAAPQIETIIDIRLEEATPGGRIQTMVIVTPAEEWSVCSDQIRWALGRPSRPTSILPSARFVLELMRNEAGHVTGAIATGSGYGHGIGMCQCGMIGRARAGQGYRHILTTYYHDVSVSKVY